MEARLKFRGRHPWRLATAFAVLLDAGSFISVLSKYVVRFACVRKYTMFVYSDGPFAIQLCL